jgi:hypothetical protein
LVVVAGLAALAFAPGDGSPGTGPCGQDRPRDLPGAAAELAAGDGIWSAWITYPPVVGETITVLWRAEGFVPGKVRLRGADDSAHRLAVEFGPSPVLPLLRGGGLLWPRPGREWGSHVRFSHPGCWHLVVNVGERRGEIDLWVRR